MHRSDRPVANISKWSHLILWLVQKTWSAIADSWQFVVRAQSRSQSFVTLDQRSENESSGSIHFQITMENRVLHIRFYCAVRSLHLYILVPKATILLTCGRDRELWLCPTPEVRDSRTSRQIWQIWLAENMKRILCTCPENRVRPELSIPAACQKDRGSGDENGIYSIYGACLKWILPELSFSDRWSRGTKLCERDSLGL